MAFALRAAFRRPNRLSCRFVEPTRVLTPSHKLVREFQVQKKPHYCSSLFKMAVREGLCAGAPPFGAIAARCCLASLGSNPRGFSPSHKRLREFQIQKKAALLQLFFKDGGEGGIRTLDTLPYTHFPGVLLQPLGHLTVVELLLGVSSSPFNRAVRWLRRTPCVLFFIVCCAATRTPHRCRTLI